MAIVRDFMKLKKVYFLLSVYGKIKECVVLLCGFCLFICFLSCTFSLVLSRNSLGHYDSVYRTQNEKSELCLRGFLFLNRLL